MSRRIDILVNGQAVQCDADATVAAALLNANIWAFRQSVDGEARGPLCGMGICYECRVRIDGVAHQRACMQLVRDGMEIRTGG